jgi:hypothetical protein
MRIAEWTMKAGLVLLCTAGPASAQASEDTAQAAKQLVEVLTPQAEGFNPRYMAAADPADADRFVAAMLIPGVQLVIVSADYKVPVLLRERLLTGKFQDAYIDLSTATDEVSRLTIEDIQADGLAFKPPKGVASGDLIMRDGEELRLDGQWRKKRMKEEEYRAAFDESRADYVRIVGLLLAQAKQQP